MASDHPTTLTDKTLTGFFWLLSSSAAQSLAQLAVTAVLARLLEPAEFGLVAAAMVIVYFAELFYELGIGASLVQLKLIDNDHINTAFSFSVLFGLILAAIFQLVNPLIADFYRMPALTDALNVLVWIFPFRTISQISYSLLQREMLFKKLAGLDVASYTLGYGIVGVTLALMGSGVWALVWANLVQAILYALFLFLAKRHSVRFRIKIEKLKELLAFGSGYTISQVLNFLARKLDYILVGRLLDASNLGIYSRAFALMNAPNNIAGTVMAKVLYVSYAKIQDSPSRLGSGLEKSYALLFMVSMPLGGLCIVLAPDIIRILLGEKWTEAVLPFQILVAFMFCRVGYKIGGTFLKSLGKVYLLSVTQLIYLVLVFVGTYFGVAYGISGVAMGVSLAIFVNFVFLVCCTFYFSELSVIAFVSDFLRYVLLSIVILAPSYGIIEALRNQSAHSLIVLASICVYLLLALWLTIRFAPPFLLGTHGVWMVDRVRSNKFVGKLF